MPIRMTRVAGYLVASMADDAAKQLRQNKAVLYLQRVGEPEAAGSPRRRVEAEAMHVRATPEYTAPTWSSGAYTYDGAGNITAIGTAASKSSDDRTNTYVYDANSRLTGWTDSTLTSPEAYTYDVYGNMTAVTRHTGMTIAFDPGDSPARFVPSRRSQVASPRSGGDLWPSGTVWQADLSALSAWSSGSPDAGLF
jgi:YD repeat-containing protein